MNCYVTDCENPAAKHRNGLCHAHHSRLKRHGDVQAHIPLKNGRPKTEPQPQRDPYPQIDTRKVLRQTFV